MRRVQFLLTFFRCDTSIAQLAHDIRNKTSSTQMEADRMKQATDANRSKVDDMESQVRAFSIQSIAGWRGGERHRYQCGKSWVRFPS